MPLIAASRKRIHTGALYWPRFVHCGLAALEVHVGEPLQTMPPAERLPEKWLDSWKAIAAYLNRDVTTVQRWEKREGMPVHRHLHAKRGSVYALPEELDGWIQSRRSSVQPADESDEPEPESEIFPDVPRRRPSSPFTLRKMWFLPLGAVLCLGIVGLSVWFVLRHRTTRPIETKIQSLAVLPLRNLSGEPAQQYLADGVTEALIGRLSTIHDLRVISHTSVSRFKDPQISVPEIVKELGVDAVVEGSVTKQGDRLRVTAQLIRGTTDEHLWSETYDRKMSDALTLESELAQSIAEKVQVAVTGEERQRLSYRAPVAAEVYELYLKGQFALGHGNKADVEQSIEYFQQAVKQDAGFAPAYLGLALAYSNLGTVFAGVPPGETRPKVILFAQKALALDPNLAEAHMVLADTLQEEWHWAEAGAEYQRALAISPNDADALAEFAIWLSCQGRSDESVLLIQRARAIDPTAVSGGTVSWILFHARRYDDAIREARSAVAVQPDSAWYLFELSFPLIANNQAVDAIPGLERSLSLSHQSPAVAGMLVHAYARAGRRNDALRLLAEMNRQRKTSYVPAGAFVNAYLGLGDTEQTFFWLERSYKEQSNILQFLKTHPQFDPIRSDPRFADLLRRVGLN
jgi:pentatricopeptide repeat protein